jgi:hypothetical protein
MAEGEKGTRPPRRRRPNRPVIVERKGDPPRKPGEAPVTTTPTQPASQGAGQQQRGPRGPGGQRHDQGQEQRGGGRDGGGRDGGGRDRDDRRGRRPRKGGKGPRRDDERKKAAPVIRTVEVTVEKGKDFVIRKRTDFDEKTRKPVGITYTLAREGLPAPTSFKHLSAAREAAVAPLPEPPPPPPETPEPEAGGEEPAATPEAPVLEVQPAAEPAESKPTEG